MVLMNSQTSVSDRRRRNTVKIKYHEQFRTSRPCHYTVIEDDNDFTADDLQKLTYYLCHTYVRCTKSISCPAPVMYAHLAAFRARQHLLTQMDESSASSDTSSSFGFHPIPESVMRAIKVVDGLKNTMYFV
ncbi:Protein argonaute-3 [Araneus ventricosus]|uniref:Protein argonaute-3 n=1 Tax=Araneus ventricosus TaxID=182803 RepID=A0A4Y2RQF4_ARAVE|nr:Protein argonaute-3 [Araneus ventricosus]